MGFFISIGVLLLLISGCSNNNQVEPSLMQKGSASEAIATFKKQQQANDANIPAMVLPPVYQEISVFDNQKITFSAEKANFHKVLYAISKIAGLNLIIDNDVVSDQPITLTVQEANLKDVLDIVMNISGTYYKLTGNILHVKQFMRKRFFIPYVHTSTSFKTKLGGDTLGSASGGSSSGAIKGDFALNFDNPKKLNDFYEALENNIKVLVSKEGGYTLNRFSGILSVYDKKKNIDALDALIQAIKKQTTRVVLIEAKILEVTLNKGHQLGVDWSHLTKLNGNGNGLFNVAQTLALTGTTAGSVAYTSASGDFSAVINALDSSGDVSTLSNPRIKVLSGQSAILSSGKLIPFWEKEVQITQGTGGSASTSETTYTRRDVLDGVTMGVTPTIMENNKIMLNVIPISSSIESVKEYFNETGVSVASAPVLNIKEAGTIIYAKNNDLVLIGGLISNTTKKEKENIPLLGKIPVLGQLFSRTINSVEKKELVILLKLRIIQ